MLKVNNKNIRRRRKICSNLTLKTLERRHWRCSGVFIVNFEHIFTPSSSVFIANFEQVMIAEIAGYFSSFTRQQKFYCVLLKNFTHFLTHSRPHPLSYRNQSIWFVVNWFAFNMSDMVVWNGLRSPSLWNKGECRHSNFHLWTENKRRIQNSVKHLSIVFCKNSLRALSSQKPSS